MSDDFSFKDESKVWDSIEVEEVIIKNKNDVLPVVEYKIRLEKMPYKPGNLQPDVWYENKRYSHFYKLYLVPALERVEVDVMTLTVL